MTKPITSPKNIQWLIEFVNFWLSRHPKFANHPSTGDLRKLLASSTSISKEKHKLKMISQIELELRKINIAYHETGHAVAFYFLTNSQEVQEIFIDFNSNQTVQTARNIGMARTNTIPDPWPDYVKTPSHQQIASDMIITHAAYLSEPNFGVLYFTGTQTKDLQHIHSHMSKISYTMTDVEEKTNDFLLREGVMDSVELIALQGYISIKSGVNIVSYAEILSLLTPIHARL